MSLNISSDYKQTGDILLRNQDTLRKLVGILGILLPLFLWGGVWLDTLRRSTPPFTHVLPSMSHYYYTRVTAALIIAVSLIAIFLMVYKGEKPKDAYVSTLAGTFAMVLLLFPTYDLFGSENGRFDQVALITKTHPNEFRSTLHYIAAGIFLTSLAYMSYFLFTKSNLPIAKRTARKKIRNRIYRTCAILMVLAMVVMFCGFKGWIDEKFYNTNCLTFWMEFVAVEAFGVSWMVKGRSILTDRNTKH